LVAGLNCSRRIDLCLTDGRVPVTLAIPRCQLVRFQAQFMNRFPVPADALEQGRRLPPRQATRDESAIRQRDAPSNEQMEQPQEVAPSETMLFDCVQELALPIHPEALHCPLSVPWVCPPVMLSFPSGRPKCQRNSSILRRCALRDFGLVQDQATCGARKRLGGRGFADSAPGPHLVPGLRRLSPTHPVCTAHSRSLIAALGWPPKLRNGRHLAAKWSWRRAGRRAWRRQADRAPGGTPWSEAENQNGLNEPWPTVRNGVSSRRSLRARRRAVRGLTA
jgi:hypothetical protein